ncbi:MAG: hypothetical protein AAGC79_07425 [Pseudomonadota bacterium]
MREMPPFPSMKAPPPRAIHPTCLLMSAGASGAIVLFIWAIGSFSSFAVFLLFVLWMIFAYWLYENCSQDPENSDLLAVHKKLMIGDQSGEKLVAITDQRVEPEAIEAPATPPALAPPAEEPAPPAPTADEADAGTKPELMSSAPAEPDDLTKIKGVGKVLAGELNEMGIYKFSQIASWSEENVKFVDEAFSPKGRVTRDGWVDQAKALMG